MEVGGVPSAFSFPSNAAQPSPQSVRTDNGADSQNRGPSVEGRDLDSERSGQSEARSGAAEQSSSGGASGAAQGVALRGGEAGLGSAGPRAEEFQRVLPPGIGENLNITA